MAPLNAPSALLKNLRIDRRTPSRAPPSRRWRWSLIALIALLAAGFAATLRPPRIPVHSAAAVALTATDTTVSVLDASGYVVARRMATVSAKITGKVRDVMIEEGMRVDKGQVMAMLDPVDAGAQRALLASQVQAARSQIAGLRAQLRQADAEVTRLQPLVARQLVSRSRFGQAVAQRDSARAQLDTAQRNVQVADRQLAIAELNVDNNTVRAPFTGVVTAKAAQPGEIVSPLSAGGGFTRTGIGTLVDMDSLEIQVEVGEAFIGRVHPKMPVEATLNAYPDWKIPAEVIAIIPTANRGKATVMVRVAIRTHDPRIVPEMGVRVSFLEQASADGTGKPQGVRVPANAVVERERGSVVFVLVEGAVQQRAVKPGLALGADRQLLQGVRAGERVVTNPPDTLHDGSRIEERS